MGCTLIECQANRLRAGNYKERLDESNKAINIKNEQLAQANEKIAMLEEHLDKGLMDGESSNLNVIRELGKVNDELEEKITKANEQVTELGHRLNSYFQHYDPKKQMFFASIDIMNERRSKLYEAFLKLEALQSKDEA